ncbi:BamA/TamA family outer membrane protein [bacterium]|nr:BamA/TamA family outer membrane protein [bacterium]
MISGWNPRPASRRCDLLILLALLVWGSSAVGKTPLRKSPVVVPGVQAAACPDCGAWFAADNQWSRQQVPTVLDGMDVSGLAEAAPDSFLTRTEFLARLLRTRTGNNAPEPPVRSLAARLRDRWLERGYLEAQVTFRTGKESGPDTLVVNPGPEWTLADFEIEGPDFPGRDELLQKLLPPRGKRFAPEGIRVGAGGILAALGESGYPFPRWVTRGIDLDPQAHTVLVNASLLPGRPAVIGPVTSSLESGPGKSFLVRTSGLRRGDPVRSSALDLAVQRLQARDLYAEVGRPRIYLTSSPDTVGIHFPVVPRRKVNRVQAVLGVSRSSTSGPSRISGQVDLDLPNMAGTGRGLQAGWRDDGAGMSRIGFQYREPLVLGSPLDMQAGLGSEIRKGVYTRFEADGAWELPVVALWGLGLELGWDRSTYPTGTLERTSRSRAGGFLLHRRGNRDLSGWSGRFGITSAWGSDLSRIDQGDATSVARLGTSTTVRIYSMDFAGELRLGAALGLAGRISYREQTGGREVVPLGEQFWFGGANTLRGYNEREFHGSRAAWGGVELRVGSVRSSRVYTFWDLGYFEFRSEDPTSPGDTFGSRGYPRGYGLGLLARTRGGDLSLAVGFPGTVDFDLAKLHVTLLESF